MAGGVSVRRRLIAGFILSTTLWLTIRSGVGGANDAGPIQPTPVPTATVVNNSPEAIVVSSPDGSRHEIHHSGGHYKGHWDCHYYAISAEKRPDYQVLDPNTPITPAAGDRVALL